MEDLRLRSARGRIDGRNAARSGAYWTVRNELAEKGRGDGLGDPCQPVRAGGQVAVALPFGRLLRLAHERIRSSVRATGHRTVPLLTARVRDDSSAAEIPSAKILFSQETAADCSEGQNT